MAIVFATTVFGTPQEGVREYEWEYPDESEQEFLQDSDQWRGTAWLKCIDRNEDWQGTDLNHYGNEYSTVRLTDCEFRFYNDYESTSVKVAVELVDDEDGQKPALFARDLMQGVYNFDKIKGNGTLRVQPTDHWSSSAIVIKNYDQFSGSIEAECAVVFGEVEDPERSDTGLIVIPEDATVTIAEGKHFTMQELKIDGVLIVNGALNVGMVSGSGTVVLPAEIQNGTNIGVYGCDESTIMFSDDFTGHFSNGCRIRGNLDLDGNTITLTGGDNTEPYVINRLVGYGILNIDETSQPITIREVLDMSTFAIAYQGRIIGDTDKVTLPEGFKIDSHGYICLDSETRYYVTLPSETTGGSYVVSNLTAECTIEPTEAGGSTYALPDGAKVGIYMVPKKGYVVTGDPYIINEIKSDKTIDESRLPKATSREQAALEAVFGDGAVVTPITDDAGDPTNYLVTVTKNLTGPVVLPEVVSNIVINLAGYSIEGAAGAAGSATTPGGDGGPAIMVSNSAARIEIVGPGTVKGGKGGDGNPPGKGAPAVVDADGNEVVVSAPDGIVSKGDDGESTEPEATPITSIELFTTGDDQKNVSVVIAATPGKTYQLLRSEDLMTPVDNWDPIKAEQADDDVLTLVDPNPPAKQAFYRVMRRP